MNPLVWVERTAVGITAASTPIAEISGSATVEEHFPKQEISWMVTIRFSMKGSRPYVSEVDF